MYQIRILGTNGPKVLETDDNLAYLKHRMKFYAYKFNLTKEEKKHVFGFGPTFYNKNSTIQIFIKDL